MSANKYDLLKEKLDFWDTSNIPDKELFSFKKPASDADALRSTLEETLKRYEDNIELYTTEL